MAAIGDYALICLTSPNGVRLLFEALAAAGLDARALCRRHRRGDRARHRRAPSPSAGSPPTSSPSASSPRPWSKRSARSRSSGARSSSPAPPRPATSSPTPARARRRGRRRRPLRDGARGARAGAVEAAQSADYVTFTSSSTVRNLTEALGERFPRRRPHRLDRPGHQRGRARRRPRGRRRGRAPRHRRPARGPARRRRRADDDPGCALARPRGMRTGEVRAAAPALSRSPTRPTRAPASWPRPARPHGTVVTAAEQTAGRGRQGRTWTAPPGKALLYSAILRPLDERHLLLPLAVAARRLRGGRGAAPGIECRSSGPTTSGSRAASSPGS